MEFPTPKRVVTVALLTLVIYAVLLPPWWHTRYAYARTVCATATHLVMPGLGLPGSVRPQSGRWITVSYTLPDARTQGWGQVRQRFLDFSDVPLGIALSLALLFLPWRRRVVVGIGSLTAIFLCHLGFLVWTATRLTHVMKRTDLPLPVVDATMHATTQVATAYGNTSTVVTIGIVLSLAAIAAPRSIGRG